MSEHLSGFRPELQQQSDSLPTSETDFGDIEAAYRHLSPSELAQIRQAAAEVAADMEGGQRPLPFAPDNMYDAPLGAPSIDHRHDTVADEAPLWGNEPLDIQLLPNEAPTFAQREHTRQYLFILATMTERRYRYEETVPAPAELLEAHAAYLEVVERENQNLPPSERLPAFTPTHLYASARRQNSWIDRWLEEQYGDTVPQEFAEMHFIFGHLEKGLEEALRMLE